MDFKFAVVMGTLLLAGCGDDTVASLDTTVATVWPVRGDVRLGEASAPRVARAAVGQPIATGADALARVHLDVGTEILLGPETRTTVDVDGLVSLAQGLVFADVLTGDIVELSTESGQLRLSDAAASVSLSGARVEVYVVRGEVGFQSGETRGSARAGERLILTATAPVIETATLWEDWTGGLARPGPSDDEAPRGVGMLEARVPDEIGRARWPLAIRRLDVRVRVEGDLAITEVEQEFFNPASETVEGLYRVRVPQSAVLQRFAVDREGRLVDGYVREKAQARQAYEAQVYRGSTDDPALLEWDAPGAYRARIYPIAAGESRRIVIRYAEWLARPRAGAPRIYTYPMGGGARAPHVQELFITADLGEAGATTLRAGLGASVEGTAVELRQSDVRPRADFWLELVDGAGDGDATPAQTARRAAHAPPARDPGSRIITNEADERDYWYLPLVLPEGIFGSRLARVAPGAEDASGPGDSLDLVVVADVSAATDRTHLELGQSVVESLAAHLGAEDRIAIVTSDLAIRSVDGTDAPSLGAATPERLDALLEGLSRVSAGGATDIGAAVVQAAELLDPTRNGAVIYVGDGAPTVGELGAEGLLTRFARLNHPLRFYAVGVGASANLDLLETLTRGGGLAVRVEERTGAADAALELLAHATRPLAQRVEVDLGAGIDNAFPRRPVDVVRGEVLPIAGRVRGDPPSEVTVRGLIRGEPFEVTVAVSTKDSQDATDLRLRWAGERLRQQLLEGATREEIAELGTRYGLITPFTSYYVPSARELRNMGPGALNLIDRGGLMVDGITRRYGMKDLPRRRAAVPGHLTRAPLLAVLPLAMAACDDGAKSEAAPSSAPEQGWPSSNDEGEAAAVNEPMMEADEEAQMGGDPGEPQGNRYADQGPAGTTTRTEATTETRRRPAATPAPIMPEAEPAVDAPRRARRAGAAQHERSEGAGPPADQAAFGEEAANDQDRMAADGNLGLLGDMEEDVSGSFGFGGMGMRGTGRGGGGAGDGTIALDSLLGDSVGGREDDSRDSQTGLGSLGTIGHGSGGGTGSGYGRGAQNQPSSTTARVRSGNAEVRGSLSREVIRRIVRRHSNEVRFCYEQRLQQRPDLAGVVTPSFVISPTGRVQSASIKNSTLGDATVEQCLTLAIRRWQFPAPNGGGIVVVNYPFTFSKGGGGGVTTRVRTTYRIHLHRARRCSDAAGLMLDDRRALWRERLGRHTDAAGWVGVYDAARTACEVPSWRDRRALLRLILNQAGGVTPLIGVYRHLSDSSARRFMRAAILRRVRSPEDLRAVRDAFGLTRGVDGELVRQVISRAGDGAGKIRAIRGLIHQFPFSFDLKLRLLEELEAQDRVPEAKRLAHRLRRDPLADPGVRTAIGEMYLRVGDEDEARRVFSEIVEFAPLDEMARRRLGDLYRAHGWYEEAYRQYQTLAEIRPDDPSVLLYLAQAAAGAGRVDEALRLEQRVAETEEPGMAGGAARAAILWSSVRFAKLRREAEAADDQERVEALLARMRRSGVLREAGDLRVTLTWSHPDARLSLWAAHPQLGLSRPTDIVPEHGLEAFDIRESEDGRYRIEVRRAKVPDEDRATGQRATPIAGELIMVWNEGQEDQKVEVMPVVFEPDGPEAVAWVIEGRDVSAGEAEGWPEVRR
ncbi:MAG: TonB family protein [Deltaproteobacteria bacterium]|nr:TonB family protein [Deltaproteobacteria bacterium]